ncbi:hypothetical protein CTI12_AA141460 [Artemisia annua]|uniref:Bifunctional inhibitor/plant lipid transfer protein/seed storage helical domain-containing protein n=1 Tax=Artemisia annua TaxID=35608 RepID=A0A2U1PKF5_ARTAN|nr:hypothetical protein CTI12_AA141460 [Artemisia annua]
MDRFTGLLATVLAISVITVTGQITTPCTVSMIASFSPCLNFITGSSANGGSPTKGCCDAFESLMDTSSQCVCLIVTGNVPISLPSQINQALAITLPKACNSKSVPLQCRSTGVPLPPPGPALFVPPPPKLPPPRAFPPAADSPELPPSPSGPETTVLAPTPTEVTQDDLPEPDPRGSETPDASAPTTHHGSTTGSGIRPVLTPASASNALLIPPGLLLLMILATTVTNFREVFIFRCIF